MTKFIRERVRGKTTIRHQLHILTIGVLVPFVILIVAVIYLLSSFNRQYNTILQNITTASEFNVDFKENVDLDMYHYVVGSKEMDPLPLEEVDSAKAVIKKLKKTTKEPENKWRVKSLLRFAKI